MTYEKGLFAQADPGIVSGSTIERKKMSTKTSFKRIALVAVAGLVSGLVSVTPANASAADVVSIYASKYSIASGYTGTFPGTSAAVSSGSTAVTLVSGTFAAADIGKAIYNRTTTGGYIGTISAVNSATSITLAAGATSALVAANTGLAASLFIGTPATTVTPATIINADGISGMSVVGGSAAAIVLRLSNPEGTATTGTARYIIDNAGVVGTSAAIPAAATTAAIPFTAPSAPGTYTGKIQYSVAGTYLGTAADQIEIGFTLTVTAAPTLDLGLSTAFMTGVTGGANASSTTNAVARTGAMTTGTDIAQVKVTLLNSNGVGSTAAHVVTADVSGVGYVNVDTNADTFTNSTKRSDTDNAGQSVRYVQIEGDGTSGEGTVTVYVTHVVTGVRSTLGTFKYTTYADVAKLEVSTKNFTIGLAGGDSTGQANTARTIADNARGALDDATTTPAFVVKATDAAGRVANAAAAPTIVSSASTVVASGTCVIDNGATVGASSGTGVGFYNCAFTTAATSKSGDKATLTIRIVDPADATKFITTTIDVTVGGSISAETLAFNKATYAPGEGMVITRTGKDSAGNPVADGSTAAAITFSTTVGGTTPAAGFYVGGVSASSSATANPTVFAPATSGAFQALMTSGNAAATKLSASATVGASADMAAITTLINSLVAKINALNKLVIKIQKKVRA
jgi:trimeric autotransporter adhesin